MGGIGLNALESLVVKQLVTRNKVWGCRESIRTGCNMNVER